MTNIDHEFEAIRTVGARREVNDWMNNLKLKNKLLEIELEQFHFGNIPDIEIGFHSW